MIFLSLVFLTLSLIVLVKGNLMNGLVRSLDPFRTDESISKLSEEEKLKGVLKILVIFTYIIFHTLFWSIYLVKAISIDIYIYPTLIMIALFIFGWIKSALSTERRKKLKDEYKNKPLKDRTLWRTIASIINITYFSYMIWILIF
ncbi:hypothetical protein [Psychrobacillus phage Perkons]|nr:hypothetical protein [Psychrobacillus phage Perkons]